MISKDLIEFIRGGRASGKTDAEIRQMLVSGGGWTEADVEEGLGVSQKKVFSLAARGALLGFYLSLIIWVIVLLFYIFGGLDDSGIAFLGPIVGMVALPLFGYMIGDAWGQKADRRLKYFVIGLIIFILFILPAIFNFING